VRVVAGIVKDSRGRVLIGQRKDGERRGLWEFPGGKVEPGERDEDALKREFQEEFAMEVKVERFLGKVHHRYPDINIDLVAYLCTPLGKMKRKSSHTRVEWVKWEDLFRYPLSPADEKLIKTLKKP